MKICLPRLVLMLLIVGLAIGFLGCASHPQGTGQTANFLGLVTVTDSSFEPANQTTVSISSKEIGMDEDLSGRQVELLWGLITLTDY